MWYVLVKKPYEDVPALFEWLSEIYGQTLTWPGKWSPTTHF